MTDKDRSKDRDRSADPRTADEQKTPQPVRPPTIQEKEGQSRPLDNPPKAEGNRDEVDDGQEDD